MINKFLCYRTSPGASWYSSKRRKQHIVFPKIIWPLNTFLQTHTKWQKNGSLRLIWPSRIVRSPEIKMRRKFHTKQWFPCATNIGLENINLDFGDHKSWLSNHGQIWMQIFSWLKYTIKRTKDTNMYRCVLPASFSWFQGQINKYIYMCVYICTYFIYI